MGTRTADFGRLVSAFHLEILEGSVRKFGTGLYLPTSVRKDEEAAATQARIALNNQGNRGLSQTFLILATPCDSFIVYWPKSGDSKKIVDKFLINYNSVHPK
jgi:hypothetical protein